MATSWLDDPNDPQLSAGGPDPFLPQMSAGGPDPFVSQQPQQAHVPSTTTTPGAQPQPSTAPAEPPSWMEAAGQQGGDWEMAGGATPQSTVTGDPTAAAQRSSGGYNDGAADTQRYQSQLDAVRHATDAAGRATAQDELARTVQRDLEADGHKVTWKGNTLMVDGRAYELGGLPVSRAERGDGSGETTQAGSYSAYDLGRGDVRDNILNTILSYGTPSPTTVAQAMRDHPELFRGARLTGTRQDKLDFGSAGYVDIGGATARGQYQLQWIDPSQQRRLAQASAAPHAGGQSLTSAGGSMMSPSAGGANPELLSWLDPNRVADNADYLPEFLPTELGLPGFEQLYSMANSTGKHESMMDAYIEQLLANPESISEQDIEMLKAKNAEELAGAAQLQDEEMQHFGFGNGLESSPWLSGQRAENQWNRRAATVDSNRDVEMKALERKGEDRRAVGALGASYANMKTSKHQNALNFAVEGALATAGETRNRHAMNESLRQAAVKLGMDKDQLVLNYVSTNLDYLTKNKQIDLGFTVDMAKLNQQSEQFKEELAFKIAELKQRDDQFRAGYQLDLQEFTHNRDQDYWTRAKETYTGS